METRICGIQQIGVGIANVVEAYNWYIKAFGVDIKVTDADGVAERMLPYTGGKPRRRRAILAANLQGGGGFEVWQPMDNNLHYPTAPAQPGDLGIFAGRIKCLDAKVAYDHMLNVGGAKILGAIATAPNGGKHFFMTDPYGNVFDVVEDSYVFQNIGCPTGGTDGEIIGVTDMDKSLDFYAKLVGYDTVVYDQTGVFDDLKALPGGDGRFRRVLITTKENPVGPLSKVYGKGHIELLQALDRTPVKLFEGRWWGDPGFIQLCFDIKNMEGIRERANALGHDFVCDGGVDFKMGDADGHFTYVEDPDGTLIEFVETFKIPVLKKLGIFIHLEKKENSLPVCVLKALKFMRTKGIN